MTLIIDDNLLQSHFEFVPKHIIQDIKNMWIYLKEYQLDKVVNSYIGIVENCLNWLQLHYDIITFLKVYGKLEKLGAEDDLEVAFKQGLERRPNNATIRYGYGFICQTKDDQDSAIEAFEEAIRLRPNLAGAYFGLASAYQVKGKRKLAEEECKKAIKINSDIAEPHYVLGTACMNRNELGKALHHFNYFLSLSYPYLSNYKGDVESCVSLITAKLRSS